MAVFYNFGNLPVELRIQIWELTLEPRILNVQQARSSLYQPYVSWVSSTPSPAVMRACRESRHLSLYKPGFTSNESSRYIWVNFDFDTVEIAGSLLGPLQHEKLCIRSLRLYAQHNDWEWFFHKYWRDLEGMVALESVDLLEDDDEPVGCDCGEIIRQLETCREWLFRRSDGIPIIRVVMTKTGAILTLKDFEKLWRWNKYWYDGPDPDEEAPLMEEVNLAGDIGS